MGPQFRLKQVLSLGLTAALFFQNTLFAHAAETNFWSARRTFEINPYSINPLPSPGKISAVRRQSNSFEPPLQQVLRSFDYEHGIISEIKSPKGSGSDHIVVLLQDVHANGDAQRHLSRVIASLNSSARLNGLGLEGSFEPYDLTPLQSVHNRDVVDPVAEYLMSKNQLSGPMRAALDFSPVVRVVGVDDKNLHAENVEACRAALAQQRKLLREVDEKLARLASKKAKIFKGPLKQLDQLVMDFERDRISLADYLEQLHGFAPKLNLAVETFLEAIRLERQIDLPKVESERRSLSAALEQRLSPEDQLSLLNTMVQIKSKKSPASQLYTELKSLASKNHVSLQRFPALLQYWQYLALAESLHSSELFAAAQEWPVEISARLVRAAEEKTLLAQSSELLSQRKLISLSLTPAEWSAVKSEAIAWPEKYSSFVKFFAAAELRDAAIAKHFTDTFNDRGISVLVVGGFHTAGITEALTTRGMTVVIATPRIEGSDVPGSDYLHSFVEAHTPLQKLFEGEKLFLASNPMPEPELFPLFGVLLGRLRRPSTRSADLLKELAPKGQLEVRALERSASGAVSGAFSNRGKRIKAFLKTDSAGRIIEAGANVVLNTNFLSLLLALVVTDGGNVVSYWATARILFFISAVAHEAFHVVVFARNERIPVQRQWKLLRSAFRGRSWMKTLFLGRELVDTGVRIETRQTQVRKDVSLAGPLATMGLLLMGQALMSIGGANFDFSPANIGYVLGALLFATNAVILTTNLFFGSDFRIWMSGVGSIVTCGVFFIVARYLPSERGEILPARLEERARIMGLHTQTRGKRSGGGSVAALDAEELPYLIGEKLVTPKPANLTEMFMDILKKSIKTAKDKGAQPLDIFSAIFHWRFPTKGKPTLVETHWHQWIPTVARPVWTVSKGKPESRPKIVTNRIGANGDMDGLGPNPLLSVFGEVVSVDELGDTLGWTLAPNVTDGDSPKVAGMMDLLVTKGMWDRAARLAYLMEVESTFKGSFGDFRNREREQHWRNVRNQYLLAQKPLPQNIIKQIKKEQAVSVQKVNAFVEALGQNFERCFAAHKDKGLFQEDADDLSKVNAEYVNNVFIPALDSALQHQMTAMSWPAEKRRAFAQSAAFAFFNNDLAVAMKLFSAMPQTTSSFGLEWQSSLNPDTVGVLALGQPITIGNIPSENYFCGGSAASAVIASLNTPDGRFQDLDDETGAIAIIGKGTLKIFSLAKQRELTQKEIDDEWVPVQDNDYILVPEMPRSDEDLIRKDQDDHARNIDRLLKEAQSPKSKNNRTMNRIVGEIIEKARRHEQWRTAKKKLARQMKTRFEEEKSAMVDILFVAEGKSLEVCRSMAGILEEVLPQMNIVTMSGNEYLEKKSTLFSAASKTALGSETLVFAVSQSGGDTFSTLRAFRHAERKRKAGQIKDVIAVTGEWYNKMGQTLGQKYRPSDPFCERILCNMTGRRRSEAATAPVIANRFLFKQLLVKIIRGLNQEFPKGHPYGMTVDSSLADEMDHEGQKLADFYLPYITGTDKYGTRNESTVNARIQATASVWGSHVTEPLQVSSVMRVYTFFSVLFGKALFRTVFMGWAVLLAYTTHSTWPVIIAAGIFMDVVFRILDAIFYSFQDRFFAYGMRSLQGRELRARTGGRTFTIGSPVHAELSNFGRRLFSSAPSELQPNFDGRRPDIDLLHDLSPTAGRGSPVLGQFDDYDPSDEELWLRHDGSAMSFSQTDSLGWLGGGPDMLVMQFKRPTNPQFPTLTMRAETTSERVVAEKKRVPAAAHVLSWMREMEMLAAGYELLWGMADKAANYRVDLRKKTVPSGARGWPSKILNAIILGPLSQILRWGTLRGYSIFMRTIFRTNRLQRLFTPGESLSNVVAATTRTVRDLQEQGQMERRDIATNVADIRTLGLQENGFLWLPSGGTMLNLLAHVYVPERAKKSTAGSARSVQKAAPAGEAVQKLKRSRPVTRQEHLHLLFSSKGELVWDTNSSIDALKTFLVEQGFAIPSNETIENDLRALRREIAVEAQSTVNKRMPVFGKKIGFVYDPLKKDFHYFSATEMPFVQLQNNPESLRALLRTKIDETNDRLPFLLGRVQQTRTTPMMENSIPRVESAEGDVASGPPVKQKSSAARILGSKFSRTLIGTLFCALFFWISVMIFPGVLQGEPKLAEPSSENNADKTESVSSSVVNEMAVSDWGTAVRLSSKPATDSLPIKMGFADLKESTRLSQMSGDTLREFGWERLGHSPETEYLKSLREDGTLSLPANSLLLKKFDKGIAQLYLVRLGKAAFGEQIEKRSANPEDVKMLSRSIQRARETIDQGGLLGDSQLSGRLLAELESFPAAKLGLDHIGQKTVSQRRAVTDWIERHIVGSPETTLRMQMGLLAQYLTEKPKYFSVAQSINGTIASDVSRSNVVLIDIDSPEALTTGLQAIASVTGQSTESSADIVLSVEVGRVELGQVEKRVESLRAAGARIAVVEISPRLRENGFYSVRKILEAADETSNGQFLSMHNLLIASSNARLIEVTGRPGEFQYDERLRSILTILTNMGEGWAALSGQDVQTVIDAIELTGTQA